MANRLHSSRSRVLALCLLPCTRKVGSTLYPHTRAAHLQDHERAPCGIAGVGEEDLALRELTCNLVFVYRTQAALGATPLGIGSQAGGSCLGHELFSTQEAGEL